MNVVMGFSSLSRMLGECSTIRSPSALFSFFLEVEISSRTLIPLLGQDLSTVAQRAETTVGRMFPDKLHVSWFPDRFQHYAWPAA